MKFLKLPVKIAPITEIEQSEITNAEIDWEEGYAVVNVDEIESICQEPDKFHLQ